MGDKAMARETMLKAGVLLYLALMELLKILVPQKNCQEDRIPCDVKSYSWRWGKGMRAVQQESELQSSWESAKNEAKASFGNDGMYMEKLVVEPSAQKSK